MLPVNTTYPIYNEASVLLTDFKLFNDALWTAVNLLHRVMYETVRMMSICKIEDIRSGLDLLVCTV